jgi:hypothetical protein
MTLIMGVHLLRKLYLVSDTRVTMERADGVLEYKDDFIKTFVLNKRISAVAAGSVQLASFILLRLKERIRVDSYAVDLKRLITTDLEGFIRRYVSVTGRDVARAAVIFAGFNRKNKKRVIMTRLGDAMSGQLRATGEGATSIQAVDPAIQQALKRVFRRHGRLSGDRYIKIKNVPESAMFTLSVSIRRDDIDIQVKDVECYDYAIFHPNQTAVTVQLPLDLICRLDFAPIQGPADRFLYRDAEALIAFVLTTVREKAFSAVGGHIFVWLQTIDGCAFPTGELGQVQDGKLVSIGKIFVRESDGAICYRLRDGTEGVYRIPEKDVDSGNLEVI